MKSVSMSSESRPLCYSIPITRGGSENPIKDKKNLFHDQTPHLELDFRTTKKGGV